MHPRHVAITVARFQIPAHQRELFGGCVGGADIDHQIAITFQYPPLGTRAFKLRDGNAHRLASRAALASRAVEYRLGPAEACMGKGVVQARPV